MGLIKKGEEDKKDEAPEPEIVTKLKETEKRYVKLEEEYERKLQELVLEYTEKQKPLWVERRNVLTVPEDASKKDGTPALSGFWAKALKNHPSLYELIEKWDEPVLDYLQDMEYSYLVPEDSNQGFRLKLIFAENPHFTPTVLEKEYKTEMENPFCGQKKFLSITSTQIQWKEGKNVTVEKVAKKVKGGGAKKAKQKKEKEEPRPSFFRDFFRNLSPETKLPEDAKMLARALGQDDEYDEEEDEEDEEDDEALVARLMDFDFEAGSAIKDDIIPRAIRWYTGEAAPDDDGVDDEEDEDDEEDDGDDDESEDEPSSKKAPKGGEKKKGGKQAQTSPELKPKEAAKEECKQQ